MNRLAGLDLLRGIAAMMVVACHFSEAASFVNPDFPQIATGPIGVQIFFVLSGYVILATAYRVADRRAFVLARFWRLYPTFLICIFLTTLWVLAFKLDAKVSPLDWFANLTMLPSLFGAELVERGYWSLGYEVAFYAVVATMLPAIKRGYALHLCAVAVVLLPLYPSVPFEQFTRSLSCFILGVALFEAKNRRVLATAVMVGAILISRNTGSAIIALIAVSGAASVQRLPDRLTGFAIWCGAVSYPLYLIHDQIGSTITVSAGHALDALPHGVMPMAAPAGVLIAVCCVIPLAAVLSVCESRFRDTNRDTKPLYGTVRKWQKCWGLTRQWPGQARP